MNVEQIFLNANTIGLLDEKLHSKNGFRYSIKHSKKNMDIRASISENSSYSDVIFIYHKSETFSVNSVIRYIGGGHINEIRPQINKVINDFLYNLVKEYPELLI